MKNPISILLAFLFLGASFSSLAQSIVSKPTCFMSNKGQIKDAQGCIRRDIDFVYRADGLQLLIGRGILEYIFYDTVPSQRLTMRLIKCKSSKIKPIAEGGNGYLEHYYSKGEQITNVPSAERICYKNIYPDIDWVLYLQKGKLEHEFVLNKNANAQMIKWQYSGLDKININQKGDIVGKSKWVSLIEQAPQSYAQNGKPIASAYRQINTKQYGYSLKQKGAITIDPTVKWATYQGGTGDVSRIYSACTDHNGYLYVCGITNDPNALASPGAYQTTLKGLADGFISKFDTNGHHIWTTYYGGENSDQFYNMQYSGGKLYLVGITSSLTGISTPGTAQPIYAGLDAFIVKFDTSGKRIWGTYCGGGSVSTATSDNLTSIVIDNTEKIYVLGTSTSKNNISTPGSFKDTITRIAGDSVSSDIILLKYDSSGRKIWGTYIGGYYSDYGVGLALYQNQQLYLSGYTSSIEGIATSTSHKPVFNRTSSLETDGFLMRFDTSGKRKWGTYYGGNGNDDIGLVAFNSKGAVYISGNTASDTGIASVGAAKTVYGGNNDLFLAKFDSTGKRQWATYIGGSQADVRFLGGLLGGRMYCDTMGDENNIHLFGETKSKGLAMVGAYQDTINNPAKYDAFIASVNGSGSVYYFSYYGGPGDDYATSSLTDMKNIYLFGATSSSSGIATKGSYKDSLKSATAGFIVKFAPGTPTAIKSISSLSQKMELNVFPNPTKGQITLQAQLGSGNGIAVVNIFNVVGKIVQHSEALVVSGKLNDTLHLFQTLAPGVYIVELRFENKIANHKIIKE